MGSANQPVTNANTVNLGYVLNNGLHAYCAQVFHVGEQTSIFVTGLMEKILKQSGHSTEGFLDRNELTDAVLSSLRQGIAQGFPDIASVILGSFVAQDNYFAQQTSPNANPLYHPPQTHPTDESLRRYAA